MDVYLILFLHGNEGYDIFYVLYLHEAMLDLILRLLSLDICILIRML